MALSSYINVKENWEHGVPLLKTEWHATRQRQSHPQIKHAPSDWNESVEGFMTNSNCKTTYSNCNHIDPLRDSNTNADMLILQGLNSEITYKRLVKLG